MFECDRCGLCCRSIGGIELLRELNDGTGVCRYLDRSTNLCSIYASRPLLCNVDEAYRKLFSSSMSLKEYYEINYRACETLKAAASIN